MLELINSRRNAEQERTRYVESPQRPINIAPSICHLYLRLATLTFTKAVALSIEEANTQ